MVKYVSKPFNLTLNYLEIITFVKKVRIVNLKYFEIIVETNFWKKKLKVE